MLSYLAGLALGSMLLTGVSAFAMSRRYGRWRAFLVPLMALGAILFVIGRTGVSGLADGQTLAAFAVTMAGSSVAGALLGLHLARRGRD
jgi:hypothetical protein